MKNPNQMRGIGQFRIIEKSCKLFFAGNGPSQVFQCDLFSGNAFRQPYFAVCAAAAALKEFVVRNVHQGLSFFSRKWSHNF